ncbi:hypothetical protein JTE90_028774 [Oedothorax gibbosus]|uniref:Sushi domain-containing protein n=1 Tax=Oedothorax gibbosus TaxID=931172 RepID=A0AAV6VWR2_9ARAC|nr:hypothetical protein JTE90_028774 [Oedothorax gibbosus]
MELLHAGIIFSLVYFQFTSTSAFEAKCGFPGSPASGFLRPESSAYEEGDVVSYSCVVGYILVGSPISRCTDDGSWTEDVPICDDSMTTLGAAFSTPTVPGHSAELAIDRNKDTCAYLKPKKPRWWRINLEEEHKVLSVAITMNPADKYVKFTVFIIKTEGTSSAYKRCATFSGKFGTQTIVLACAEGRGIEGQKVHIEDHHQTEGFFELCEVEVQVEKDSGYDCGIPSRNLNSNSSKPMNNMVEYECFRGYQLKGRDFRTCESTGQWSGDPPTCEPIVCDDLEPIENGFYSLSHTKDGPPLEGTDVIYKCDEGYKLEGPFMRNCLRDGSWSKDTPECKAIRCPLPDGKELGGVYRMINGTNSMGSMAMLRCQGGKIDGDNIYITCTEDETWTKPEARCVIPALASYGRTDLDHVIVNQGAIIFGMVVAAIMIVVALVGLYLYGQRRNGNSPELPERLIGPVVPPPRPPPRSKGGSFKNAFMGFMNRDGSDKNEESLNSWKTQSLPTKNEDSGMYSAKRALSYPDKDGAAIIEAEVLPHVEIGKSGRYSSVPEENEEADPENVVIDMKGNSPTGSPVDYASVDYEKKRQSRLLKEQDSVESSSTAGASPLPADDSEARSPTPPKHATPSESEEEESEEEESQGQTKAEEERKAKEEEERKAKEEEERKAKEEEERKKKEEEERKAKEEEEKKKVEIPRRRRLRDEPPAPQPEERPALRRVRKFN